VNGEKEALAILLRIATVLRVELTERDVVICHPLRSNKPDRPKIIARLVNRWKINELIVRARKQKLKASDLRVAGESVNVYISEHLAYWQKGIKSSVPGTLRNRDLCLLVWARITR